MIVHDDTRLGGSGRARRRPVLLAATASIVGGLAMASALRVGAGDGAGDEAGPVPGAVREAPAVLDPRACGIGELLPDVAFTDIDGKAGKLSDYRGRTVVVVLRSVGCPVGKKYAPRIARLEQSYAKSDVAFLLVNPMEGDAADAIRGEIAAHGFAGRYIADRDGAFVRALGVQSTTEAFVIDGARTLAYRGALDDQYGLGYAREKPQDDLIGAALDAVLAGRRPLVEATSAPGCRIAAGDPTTGSAAAAVAGAPTWHGRIARVMQRSCQECHRPGMSGPFPLVSYEDAKSNREMVSFMVEKRAMPPWFVDGEKSHRYRNDRSLSERDRRDVLAWIEAGCPEGDAKDAPIAASFAAGWSIGEPDAVITAPEDIGVPAEGTVPYKNIEIRTDFGEDKWATAMEVQCTANEQVHHILVFLRYPQGHPRAGEQPDYEGGLKGYFAAMVPGQADQVLPDGMAKYIPRGARMRLQIHYTTNGKAAKDRPRVGFKFASGLPRSEMKTGAISNTMFRIPPGDPGYKIGYSKTFKTPTRILGFLPHMHLRGKSFRYTLTWPDGRKETVLEIPRYDFNWQLMYRLAEPIDVPPGAELRAEGWFDNSKENPANPDPTRPVQFGEQTWEEMMIGYFDYIELDAAPPTSVNAPAPAPRDRDRPRRDRERDRDRPSGRAY